jgi:hypothetical protein
MRRSRASAYYSCVSTKRNLRVNESIHLKDAIANDGNVNDVGKLVTLSSTFTGSSRHIHEYAQDTMTYVRNYDRPDLLVTFTCYPKWEEVQEVLLPGQTQSDRHDLLARVFKKETYQVDEYYHQESCIRIGTLLDVFG